MSPAERTLPDSSIVHLAPQSESEVTVTVHMSREQAARIVAWENKQLATVPLGRTQTPPAPLGTAVMSVLGQCAGDGKG